MEPSTVLVVDDDVETTRVLERLLVRRGLRVLVANDGREALAKAASAGPDLIILDAVMPGLSGHDVCWALRADEKTRAIPIMMLSGRGEPEDQVAGLSAGVDTYAVKPFDPRELTLRVDSLLQSRAAARAGHAS